MTVVIEERGSLLELICEGEKIRTCDKKLFFKQLNMREYGSKDDFESHFFEIEYKVAFAYSLRKIASKSIHSKELRQLLQKKLITEATIQRILSTFSEKKWLKDEEWLQFFVEKLVKQGKSAHEIFHKAKMRGIEKTALLPFFQNSTRAKEALSILIRKRYPQLLDKKSPVPMKEKAMAALFRKGFSFDDIRAILLKN